LSIDGRLQVQDAHSLETSWPQEQHRMLQILRAAGARHAVVASLRLAGRELVLELHVHEPNEATLIQIRAASVAGLVVPAVSAAATPEAIAAAMAGRSPGVHVLFARLARRDEALSLEYVLVSPVARTEGSMLDRSPTALGRRLAAKLLRRPHSHSAQAPAHAEDDDAWMIEMLDLASRAAEEHRWGEALQVLDVVLDQDPDHGLAADFKARMRGRR